MTSMFRGPAQAGFNFAELVIDNFAGGGGASTGIEAALGRPVDVAINHDPDAIRMHEVNHPHTTHYRASVWDVDPLKVAQGRPIGLVWFSPDCTHFSKARGGTPVRIATIGFRRTISGENAEGKDKGMDYRIAGCRAIVIALLGDEVDVPEVQL